MANNKNLETYTLAKDLWMYEGNLVWQKFNNFLISNSILLSVILLTGKEPFLISRYYFSIFGFLLCISWFFTIARGFKMHNYWIGRLKEMEKNYQDIGDGITQCGKFLDDKEGDRHGNKTSPLARQMRTRFLAFSTIALFTLIYVFILLPQITTGTILFSTSAVLIFFILAANCY